MTSTLNIYFDKPQIFEPARFEPLSGVTGLYFIFCEKMQFQYPFGMSKLLYIGMSEKRTNSIGKRLLGHYDGSSGNTGLTSYRKADLLLFTFLNFVMLKNCWKHRVEDLESYFINDFVRNYGVYPVCNNKTGFEIIEKEVHLIIDWQYFSKQEESCRKSVASD